MVNLNIYFAYIHFVLVSLCVFNQTNQVIIIIMLYVYMYVVYFVMYDSVLILLLSYGVFLFYSV